MTHTTSQIYHVFLYGEFYGYTYARSAAEAISLVKPSDWDADGFTATEGQ